MEIKTCEEPTCGKRIVMLRSVRQPGKYVPVDIDTATSAEISANDTDFNGSTHTSHYRSCTNPQRFSAQLHSK